MLSLRDGGGGGVALLEFQGPAGPLKFQPLQRALVVHFPNRKQAHQCISCV